jgi:hypothetical protein
MPLSMQRLDAVLLSWGTTGDMLLKSHSSVIVPLKTANGWHWSNRTSLKTMSLARARQQRVEYRKGRVPGPGKIGYCIVHNRYGCRIDVSIVVLIEQGSMGGDVCYCTSQWGVQVAQLSGYVDHGSKEQKFNISSMLR